MDLAAFTGSAKYLGKAEVNQAGITLTISGFGVEKFQDGREKPYVTWQEGAKPLLLNKNNIQRLKAIIGTTQTQAMIGRRVQVYLDPMVEMQGQLVGGLRIRAVPDYMPQQPGPVMPQPQATPGQPVQYVPVMPTAAVLTAQPFNDDIPF
jgi:hypothetical protein